MTKPPIPQEEAERIAALESYDVLDTPPEAAFDDVTLLAAEICATPIALVSLVDKERQWFKSRHGLGATQTPREVAFCAHAIHGQKVFLVEDSHKDERFRDNPLVTGAPHVRFYAGAPLTTLSGYKVGTLCVIDHLPRKLNEKQILALEGLARKVIAELELRKAAAVLSREKAALDRAQKLGRMGSWEKDLRTGALTFSDNQFELLGLSKDRPLPWREFLGLHSPSDGQRLTAAMEACLAYSAQEGGRPSQERRKDFHLEVEMDLPNKGRMVLLHTGTTECDSNGRALRFSGLTQDITQQKERDSLLQRQQVRLYSASRLATLGEMAGGIAHEINNPLTIITGKAYQLKVALEKGELDQAKFTGDLEKIQLTIERIVKIIRGLRYFSRNSEQDPMERVALSQIVADTLALCREKIRHHGVDVRIGDLQGIYLRCRPAQISQVLMNLISNSYDALEGSPEKWIEIKAELLVGTLRISFTDSGNGISPEVAAKLMQPFFTTKEVGKGTGLGLSIARGIAEEHGGLLRYDPLSARTRFVFELPALPEKASGPAPSSAA